MAGKQFRRDITLAGLLQIFPDDAKAGELAGRLAVIDAGFADVRQRLERLYDALETSALTLEALSPRILSLRHREEHLEAARVNAAARLEQRRVELPTTEEVKAYVVDFRVFLHEGTIPERKALIRNFVEGIEVVGDEATLTYTIPMPNDGVTRESTPVLDFVQSGLLDEIQTLGSVLRSTAVTRTPREPSHTCYGLEAG